MSREAGGAPSSRNASTVNISLVRRKTNAFQSMFLSKQGVKIKKKFSFQSTRTRQAKHRRGRRNYGRRDVQGRLCKMQKAEPQVNKLIILKPFSKSGTF